MMTTEIAHRRLTDLLVTIDCGKKKQDVDSVLVRRINHKYLIELIDDKSFQKGSSLLGIDDRKKIDKR